MRWTLAATVALVVLVALVAVGTPAPLGAQAPVSPDQTRAEVITRLGAPAAERAAGDLTFLIYESACAPRCAARDVVVLRGGRVVDALFASEGTGAAGEGAEVEDFGAITLRAVEPLYFYVDPTLHAARPLVARAYRLPGSFAPGEVAEFERARRGAAPTAPNDSTQPPGPPGGR